MNAVSPERNRIHPHKFTMWVAMGSIIMMFAGLTSAYVVKRAQSNWLEFDLPPVFWISTVVILASSLTIHLSLKAFKAREMPRYRMLITLTAVLGVAFALLQFAGFSALHKDGIQFFGAGSNPSASFLGIITGLHIAHVLGGVIALLVVFLRAFSIKNKVYTSVPLEIVATYWHFVDLLWIYLFVFFNSIG
ncbi:cytochrome c oxidase subunit 3 [Filimonas zeae]|nr:cytochrome c oxidase subunit 3 [Filimonas zeae]MDR6342534.1 cytochrome c oxidase subunit 3 [Filimonas zeae]